MPYSNLKDLPASIKKLSVKKQKQWMATFNSVAKTKDEKAAFKAANGVVKEAAPVGTLERYRTMIYEAFRDAYEMRFPEQEWCPYIMYTFSDKVIVEVGEDHFEIPYAMVDDDVTFGDPVKVEIAFVPASESMFKKKGVREAGPKARAFGVELKESGIAITEKAKTVDCDFAPMVSLREAKFDLESGILEVVLIEAGTNPNKMRHYPESTIEKAAPLFSGLKMYINHQTRSEESARPERDLRDWASTIQEAWYDGGKAMGKVFVHDSWLREVLSNEVARANIGVSINASGKMSVGNVSGKQMQIVEEIIVARSNGPASVDWVTEAGARGRVSRLLKESTTKRGATMELNEATFEDLKRENPSLVESITKEVVKNIAESGDAKKKEEAYQKALKENAEIKEAQARSDQKAKVIEMLKESKLPEAGRVRVLDSVCASLHESAEALKESFDKTHKAELAYVNSLSVKGAVKLGEAGSEETKGIIESCQNDLEARMGIKKEEAK